MTGAKAIVESLRREGVDIIFGYPGGAILPTYDALFDSDIRHILVRHEQSAAHAADGYARATGRVGVCMATSGPGATNLITGIANAYMDSVPIVAFTGQVPRALIGNDAFQEADIRGITMPIVKHSYLVQEASELPKIIKEAFYIASTGRPGPVLIDLPKDTTTEEIEFEYPSEVMLRGYRPKLKGNEQQIKRAAQVIASAKRPVLYVGGGAITSNAAEEVRMLAEKIGAPVTTTLMGTGAFPDDHPLALHMLGMHGTKYANYAVQESDLLIAIGARFDDRVTGKMSSFAPEAKVVHIDIDPAEIGKNVGVDVPIVGDCKLVLQSLLKYVGRCNSEAWIERIQQWKKEFPLSYEYSDTIIKPQYVVESIYRACKDAIIVTEVGQNQMWANQFFTYTEPRTFLSAGGLGPMGYGFPAAIGAKLGRPEKVVFDIAGDGSFQMNSHELATAVKSDVPVIVAILNNGYLGMVRQWQELFFGRRYAETSVESSVDFAKLAEAYGALGLRAERPSEVNDVLDEALRSNRPTVIDFVCDPEENVFPMVPAGASINEFLEG
ncbi:MAG: acetolactate synthase large subunit [Methermicoccaceae archaeon]